MNCPRDRYHPRRRLFVDALNTLRKILPQVSAAFLLPLMIAAYLNIRNPAMGILLGTPGFVFLLCTGAVVMMLPSENAAEKGEST